MMTQYISRQEFQAVKNQVQHLHLQALKLNLDQLERSPIYNELRKPAPSETLTRQQPGHHQYLGASTLDEGSLELDRKIRAYMEGNPGTDYLSSYEFCTQG